MRFRFDEEGRTLVPSLAEFEAFQAGEPEAVHARSASAPTDAGAPSPASSGSTREIVCGAYYGPPMPPDGEQGECGHHFTVVKDDPVDPTRWARCPRCGAEVEVEW